MNRIIRLLLTLLQIGLILGTYILQYLSKKKMGVLRYLDFENLRLGEGWFSSRFVYVYGILFILLSLFSLYLLLGSFKVGDLGLKSEWFIGIVLGAIGAYLSLWGSIDQFKALYFLIMGVGLASVIQIIKLTLLSKGKEDI